MIEYIQEDNYVRLEDKFAAADLKRSFDWDCSKYHDGLEMTLKSFTP